MTTFRPSPVVDPALPPTAALTNVKICGLSTAASVKSACAGGARYLGFNFFPKSPRFVSMAAARELTMLVPPGVAKVALAVDPDDAWLDEVAASPFDMIQMHGKEPPARVAAARRRVGLPVIKAIGVAEARDLDGLDAYAAVADQLLIDAKPPPGGDLPGGNGLTFDWRLVAGRDWPAPWILAGGLTAGNVAEAIRLTGAAEVDVSSGVESAPGVKDEAKIAAFLKAARA